MSSSSSSSAQSHHGSIQHNDRERGMVMMMISNTSSSNTRRRTKTMLTTAPTRMALSASSKSSPLFAAPDDPSIQRVTLEGRSRRWQFWKRNDLGTSTGHHQPRSQQPTRGWFSYWRSSCRQWRLKSLASSLWSRRRNVYPVATLLLMVALVGWRPAVAWASGGGLGGGSSSATAVPMER